MSHKSQNLNGKSRGFLKVTSIVALLLGTTSLTTPNTFASRGLTALAVNLARSEGISREEAQAKVNIAINADPAHPERILDRVAQLNTFQKEQKIDSCIGLAEEFLSSGELGPQGFQKFLEKKSVGELDPIYDALATHVEEGLFAKEQGTFYGPVRTIRDFWPAFNADLVAEDTAEPIAAFIDQIRGRENKQEQHILTLLASVAARGEDGAIDWAYVLDQANQDAAFRLATLKDERPESSNAPFGALQDMITRDNIDIIQAILRLEKNAEKGLYTLADITQAIFEKGKRLWREKGVLIQAHWDGGRDSLAVPPSPIPLSHQDRALQVCRRLGKNLDTQEGQDFLSQVVTLFRDAERLITDFDQIRATFTPQTVDVSMRP